MQQLLLHCFRVHGITAAVPQYQDAVINAAPFFQCAGHVCCSIVSKCMVQLPLFFFWMQGTAVAPLFQGACQRMQRKTTTAPLFRGADTNAALLFQNAGHNFCSISKCICTTAALLFPNAGHGFCSCVSACYNCCSFVSECTAQLLLLCFSIVPLLLFSF